MNQVKAYLALADSDPRPADFPAAADRQFAELREDLARMQRHFEALLTVQPGRAEEQTPIPTT